ncbi:RNA polymerase sigma factor [Amycolatopsis balhimycina]|nr:sigma-70 family RNA polymerase sigma factor [Amycolatopsis balhimycina]
MSQFLLGEQRWRPGLASISTTFINACIREFPSGLRKVSRAARLKALNEVLVDAMPDDVQQLTAATSSEGVDPERQTLAKLELMEVLARVTERERHILLLHGAGLTHGEIASAIDATPDAVRKMLARARKKIRKDRARRSIDLTNEEFTKTTTLIETWQHLQQWGVGTLEMAVTIKGIIDNARKTFEDSRFPALYRPSPKIPHNMLDIILDHIDVDVDREDRVSWMSKRARVTRRVLDAIRTEFPDVNRPNPHSKGAVSDLQQFYDSLKLACAPEETSSLS